MLPPCMDVTKQPDGVTKGYLFPLIYDLCLSSKRQERYLGNRLLDQYYRLINL